MRLRIQLVTVLLVLGVAGAASGQVPRKWWLADDIKSQLGLTTSQSAQVEEIFQSSMPRLRVLKQDLDRSEAELSRLVAEGTAEEAVVAHQIDRVEASRSEMSKLRTLMLFKMHRVLSTDQRLKLKSLHDTGRGDRRDRDPGSRSDDRRRR